MLIIPRSTKQQAKLDIKNNKLLLDESEDWYVFPLNHPLKRNATDDAEGQNASKKQRLPEGAEARQLIKQAAVGSVGAIKFGIGLLRFTLEFFVSDYIKSNVFFDGRKVHKLNPWVIPDHLTSVLRARRTSPP